jgi:hypothetical protein
LSIGPELDNIPVSNIKDGIESQEPEPRYLYGQFTPLEMPSKLLYKIPEIYSNLPCNLLESLGAGARGVN